MPGQAAVPAPAVSVVLAAVSGAPRAHLGVLLVAPLLGGAGPGGGDRDQALGGHVRAEDPVEGAVIRGREGLRGHGHRRWHLQVGLGGDREEDVALRPTVARPERRQSGRPLVVDRRRRRRRRGGSDRRRRSQIGVRGPEEEVHGQERGLRPSARVMGPSGAARLRLVVAEARGKTGGGGGGMDWREEGRGRVAAEGWGGG